MRSLLLAALASCVVGIAAIPAKAEAFLSVDGAAALCAQETYASHDATLRLYGSRASHINWSRIGYTRRSTSRVWVKIRRGSTDYRFSIDGWCDVSGYDSGAYSYATAWHEVGTSAPLG